MATEITNSAEVPAIPIEETVFTIETRLNTWYVDYNHITGIYKVSQDEICRNVKKTLGEALQYILYKVGSTRLKVIK
jgi:hypothetical protein